MQTLVKGPTALGDLLMTRMIYQSYTWNYPLLISLMHVRKRNPNPRYESFLRELLPVLFPGISIAFNPRGDAELMGISLPLKRVSLTNYFDTSPILPYPYIVFQTKYRADSDTKPNFADLYVEKIKTLLSTFAVTGQKIVLLGEKQMHQNWETSALGKNTGSLYNELVSSLAQKGNDVVDLTVTELGDTPDFEIFKRDIRILHNADRVIGFGMGGNMIIAAAFARNFDYMIGELKHPTCALIVNSIKKGLDTEHPAGHKFIFHTSLATLGQALNQIQEQYNNNIYTKDQEEEEKKKKEHEQKKIEEQQEGMKFYSQAGQDRFAFAMVGNHKAGTFLDIGAGHPTYFNNTYALDKIGWHGICVELESKEYCSHVPLDQEYKMMRPRTVFHCGDATKINWEDLLLNKGVDYLSLDVDDATSATLQSIPLDKLRFKVITIEHDKYHRGDGLQQEIRRTLEAHGYSLVCSDVNVHWQGRDVAFEDWFVDSKAVPAALIEQYRCDNQPWTTIFAEQLASEKKTNSDTTARKKILVVCPDDNAVILGGRSRVLQAMTGMTGMTGMDVHALPSKSFQSLEAELVAFAPAVVVYFISQPLDFSILVSRRELHPHLLHVWLTIGASSFPCLKNMHDFDYLIAHDIPLRHVKFVQGTTTTAFAVPTDEILATVYQKIFHELIETKNK